MLQRLPRRNHPLVRHNFTHFSGFKFKYYSIIFRQFPLGGQYVIVVPELDLNIVIFAGNYNQRIMHKTKYEYVRDYVLKAVAEGESN